MIKNNAGERTTPKLLAQEILIDALAVKLEFLGEDTGFDDLTDREKDIVGDQVVKQVNRIRKMFGWPELESWADGTAHGAGDK